MDSSIIDIGHRRFGNGFQFINDFKAINDGRENEGRYKAIYPTELEFKKKNTDYSEGSFLQLGIKTGHQKFNIQLHFKRSISPFLIFRMARRTSNNPSKMFCSAVQAACTTSKCLYNLHALCIYI